jgi:hypothetical protein
MWPVKVHAARSLQSEKRLKSNAHKVRQSQNWLQPGTSVLATEVSWSHTLGLFLVEIRERCSLRTTFSHKFEWPKKPYHGCGELSDAKYLSSSVGWIQVPSRCYRAAGGGHIEHL